MDETQKKLIELRKTKSVTEIAKIIGTSDMNVYRWTTGKVDKIGTAWKTLIKQRIDNESC
jgi:DNA-directed RNA polymerase specialized sigma subunit